MKANRIVCLCIAIALPQLAMATQSQFNPQALGTVQAILNFCTQVDPKDTAMFRAQWNSFGVPDQQLDSLQHTTEYKQAYDLISDALGKISKQAAAQTCAAGVTSR